MALTCLHSLDLCQSGPLSQKASSFLGRESCKCGIGDEEASVLQLLDVWWHEQIFISLYSKELKVVPSPTFPHNNNLL